MGGGATMRTVTKLAGIGVARATIRGSPAAQPTEQSVRNTSRPVSAVVSSQRAKAAEVTPLQTAALWDTDDREVTGEPMPRVVFDAVPSFQEAKSATTELKDAIDKIFLSSGSSQCEGSSPDGQVSVLSPTPETKSCVIEAISNPSVPKHALQAFQLLSTSPEAQTVVTSIACDPNVWNAVMQNPAVNSFCQSYKTDTKYAAVAGLESEETIKVEEVPEGHSGNGFVDFLQNLKLTVTEMFSSVSTFIRSIFTPLEKSLADADGNTKVNLMDQKFVGGTLMGLATMVVVVVLLKRV